jgi:hypothetical protein
MQAAQVIQYCSFEGKTYSEDCEIGIPVEK